MIHFFEIVSTLLLAFYISYLLMTIALNLANAARSENLLIISCLTVCKKPLISMFFRDMHHFSRDNRSLESCRFTLHYSRIMRIRN